MKHLAHGILVFALLMTPPARALAQRAIVDDLLALPVLVLRTSGQTGTGSGFYFRTNTSIYLVTARHVLFQQQGGQMVLLSPSLELLAYPKDPHANGRDLFRVDLAALFRAGEAKPHPSEDVAAVRLATVPEGDEREKPFSFVPGVSYIEKSGSPTISAAPSTTKRFDAVLISNEVVMFGYPTSLGLSESPQLDPLRPLLRHGIVAGVNPGKKSIVLDGSAYGGNSGGPVIEITREFPRTEFKLIGVVREFVPYRPHPHMALANSGYAIATPMDFALELMK